MSPNPKTLIVLVAAVCLSMALPAGAREKKPRPDLTGSWTFNRENSDSSSNAEAGAGGHKRPPIFGPPRGGFGPIGGAGGGGPIMRSRPDEETVARSKELTRVAAEPPRKLDIAADGATLSFTTESGHVIKVRTDGEKTFEVSEGGLELERKAHWDDDKLVIDVKAKGGGGEIKQIFTREGDQMVVQSTVESDLAPRAQKLRHVYDRE